MGRKLWLLTGGALAMGLAIGLLAFSAPSFQRYAPVAMLAVTGLWAAGGGLVILAESSLRSKVAASIAFAAAVILPLSTHWFGFAAFLLWYFGLILLLGIALVFGILLLFRRRPNPRLLGFPLTMILMGASGILLGGLSARPVPPVPQRAMSTSDELKYIYGTDQSDRFTGLWVMNLDRDRIRLQRVKTLYRAGHITEPLDEYNAAMVYQHATCADDYQVAYELAKAAAEGGLPESHPPLVHQAYDRWQMSLGKRQTYGTQLNPIPIKLPCPRAQ